MADMSCFRDDVPNVGKRIITKLLMASTKLDSCGLSPKKFGLIRILRNQTSYILTCMETV